MRLWLICAGLSGASAVLLGAYGAHGLEATAARKAWFDTAVMWQAVHAPALLGVALLAGRSAGWRARLAHAAGALFALGTVLFCGTLYAMVLANKGGMLAPAGGMMLATGWIALALAGLVTSSGGQPRNPPPG
jgi:uncharacterized membrane protein YgdD (TMEM256/DUF423 family)